MCSVCLNLYQKAPDRSVCEIRAIRIRAAGLAVMADDSSRCGERSCSSVYLVIQLPTLRVSDAGRFGLSAIVDGGDIPCVPAMIGCRPRLGESGVCSEQILLARPGCDTRRWHLPAPLLSQALFARDNASESSGPVHKKRVICLTFRLRRSRNGNGGYPSLTCTNDSISVSLSVRDLSAIASTSI